MSDAFDALLEAPGEKGSAFEFESHRLEPLIEEINLIQNEDIRMFCRSMLLKAGDAFWIAPFAAEGDDLPPDELREGGNILHVKRVVRTVTYLSYAYNLDIPETDYVIAAALLHTITKIVDVDPLGNFVFDVFHPYTVGPFAMACIDTDDKHSKAGESTSLWIDEDDLAIILRIIRCQKGVWSIVPETQPLDAVEQILHHADYLMSQMHHILDGRDIQQWRWKEVTDE